MPKKEAIKLYVHSLRLERWPRSLAIFPGVALAWLLQDRIELFLPGKIFFIRSLGAFLLTWMISTANYIVNEITDAPFDVHHPAKKHRPLVNRQIRLSTLFIICTLLVAGALLTAWIFYSLPFQLSLSGLLIAGFLYNIPPLRIKDIPYLDSTLESANNPIRFFIGWYSVSGFFPPLSLLLNWWAFGNYLMIGKRVAEKKFLTEAQASAYRVSLKKYSIRGLLIFMVLNGLFFLITYWRFARNFHLRLLWAALPLVAVYLGIFFWKSIQDRDAAEEPERLLKNPYFALFTLFLVLIFILAFWVR